MTTAAPAVQQPSINAVDEEKRERRPNPLSIAYEKKRSEIDANIQRIKERMDALRSGEDGSASGRGERSRVLDSLKEIREKTRKLRDEAKALSKEREALVDQSKKQRDELFAQKDKLSCKSVGECDQRISEIEARIETGSHTLTEEKLLLQEITRLRKNRKALENLAAGLMADGSTQKGGAGGMSGADARMREEMLKAKVSEKYAELDTLKPKTAALEAELAALDGGREEAQKKAKKRQAEVDKLKKELDAEYERGRAAYSELRDAKTKQKEAWERNKARREEEDKRREVEDAIDELEHKLASLNPAAAVDKKLDECVNIGNYFGAIVATGAEHSSQSAAPAAKTVQVDGDYVALKPKSERQGLYMAATSGPAKKSQSEKKAQSLGKLPLHILAGLADLDLSVPVDPKAVPALLESLASKKAAFEKERNTALSSVKEKQTKLQGEIDALKAKLQ